MKNLLLFTHVVPNLYVFLSMAVFNILIIYILLYFLCVLFLDYTLYFINYIYILILFTFF